MASIRFLQMLTILGVLLLFFGPVVAVFIWIILCFLVPIISAKAFTAFCAARYPHFYLSIGAIDFLKITNVSLRVILPPHNGWCHRVTITIGLFGVEFFTNRFVSLEVQDCHFNFESSFDPTTQYINANDISVQQQDSLGHTDNDDVNEEGVTTVEDGGIWPLIRHVLVARLYGWWLATLVKLATHCQVAVRRVSLEMTVMDMMCVHVSGLCMVVSASLTSDGPKSEATIVSRNAFTLMLESTTTNLFIEPMTKESRVVAKDLPVLVLMPLQLAITVALHKQTPDNQALRCESINLHSAGVDVRLTRSLIEFAIQCFEKWSKTAYSSLTHVCEPSTCPTDTFIPKPSGAMAWWNCGVDTTYGDTTPTPTPSVRSPGSSSTARLSRRRSLGSNVMLTNRDQNILMRPLLKILSSALNIINSSMTKVFTRKFTGSDESSTPMGIGKIMRNVAALRRHFQLIPIQFVFTCDRFTVELHCNAQQLNNVKSAFPNNHLQLTVGSLALRLGLHLAPVLDIDPTNTVDWLADSALMGSLTCSFIIFCLCSADRETLHVPVVIPPNNNDFVSDVHMRPAMSMSTIVFNIHMDLLTLVPQLTTQCLSEPTLSWPGLKPGYRPPLSDSLLASSVAYQVMRYTYGNENTGDIHLASMQVSSPDVSGSDDGSLLFAPCTCASAVESVPDPSSTAVGQLSLDLQLGSLAIVACTGLESWIEWTVQKIALLHEPTQTQNPTVLPLPYRYTSGSKLWSSQSVLQVLIRLHLAQLQVDVGTDFYSPLPDSASKLVSLGQIKFSSLTASTQLAFALHHTASSNTYTSHTDEPTSNITISNNLPSHIPLATMALSHLRSRRSLSSVAGSVASTIIQPLQIVAPASSTCYLSLFITPALFSLAELTMIAVCNPSDIAPVAEKLKNVGGDFVDGVWRQNNYADLVLKRAVRVATVVGQFCPNQGLLLEPDTVQIWFAPSFLQLTGPMLKLIFDYKRAFSGLVATHEHHEGVSNLNMPPLPLPVKDSLNLAVTSLSVILVVSNWMVETPFSLSLQACVSGTPAAINSSMFANGGTATVHLRDDLKRWSLKVPHIAVAYNPSHFSYPEVSQSTVPLLLSTLLYVRSYEMDGVDPVWLEVEPDEEQKSDNGQDLHYGERTYRVWSPAQMHIRAAGVDVNWDAEVQLAILRVVKQFVGAIINFKASSFHQMWPLHHSYRQPSEEALDLSFFSTDACDIHYVSAADEFFAWHSNTRASYLAEKFGYTTLDVQDLHLNAHFDQQLWWQLDVAVFQSDLLPCEWQFENVNVSMLSEPLLSLSKMSIGRRGIDSQALFLPTGFAFSERLVFFSVYADLVMNIDTVSIEIAPKFNYGRAIDTALCHVTALMTMYEALPSLDDISRSLGGPGYCSAPTPPPPGMHIGLKGLSVCLLDNPLEALIQNALPLWHQTRLELLHREQIVQHRLTTLDSLFSKAEAPVGVGASTPAASKECEPSSPANISPELTMLLHCAAARRYVKRMKALQRQKRICKAALLTIKIGVIKADMGLNGDYGSFRVPANVFTALCELDEASAYGGSQLANKNDIHTRERHNESTFATSHANPSIQSANAFSTLAGSYASVKMDDMSVHLRDFPLPMQFTAHTVTRGVTVIARHDTTEEFSTHIRVPLSSGYNENSTSDLTRLNGHGSRSILQVDVRRSYVPFRLFFDMSLSLQEVMISYSPSHEYTMADLLHIASRLHALVLDQSQHLDYWDILRLCAHGRARLNITDLSVHLILPQSRTSMADCNTTQNNTALKICVADVIIDYDSSLVELQAQRVRILCDMNDADSIQSVNHDDTLTGDAKSEVESSELLSIPLVDLQLGLQWQCGSNQPQQHYVHPVVMNKNELCCDQKDDATKNDVILLMPAIIIPRQSISQWLRVALDRIQRPTLARWHSAAAIGPLDSSILMTNNHSYVSDETSSSSCSRMATIKELVRAGSLGRHIPENVFSYGVLCSTNDAGAQREECTVRRCFSDSDQSRALSQWIESAPQSQFHKDSVSSKAWLVVAHPLTSRQLASPNQLSSETSTHTKPVSTVKLPPVRLGMLLAPEALALARSVIDQQNTELHASPGLIARDPFNEFRSTGLLISLTISLPLPKLIQNVPSNLTASTNIPPNTRMGSQSHLISSVNDIDDPSTSDRRFLDSFRPVSTVSASAAVIHSATLVSLIQFGMSYAKIPLLPLPPRCDVMAIHSAPEIQLSSLIRGLILERVSVERMTISCWEGVCIGAARGCRIGIEGIQISTELLQENLESLVDTLAKVPRSVKVFFSTNGKHIWSLANTTASIARCNSHIMSNEEWRAIAQKQEDDPLTEEVKQGKCVVVQVYENQRFVLGQGWSDRNLLILTDRPAWSDQGGTTALDRNTFKVPSDDWVWNGDWQIDYRLRNFDEIDGSGFEYAFDFPRHYSGKRGWFSNVRRRRWIRIRRLRSADDGTEMEASSRSGDHSKSVSDGNVDASLSSEFIFTVALLDFRQERVAQVQNIPRLFSQVVEQNRQSAIKRRVWRSGSVVSIAQASNSAERSMLDMFNIATPESISSTVTTEVDAATAIQAALALDGRPQLSRQCSMHYTTGPTGYTHRIAVHGFKLLITVDIRNVLIDLAMAYTSAITEVLETLSEHAFTIPNTSISSQVVTAGSPVSGPVEVSTTVLPLFLGTKHSCLAEPPVALHVVDHDVEPDFPGTGGVSLVDEITNRDTVTVNTTSDVENLFLIEVFHTQINMQCNLAQGCVSLALVQATIDGRVFWQHHHHDHYEISMVLDRVAVLVAPTDIDHAPEATWLRRAHDATNGWQLNVAVLKPIISPMPAICVIRIARTTHIGDIIAAGITTTSGSVSSPDEDTHLAIFSASESSELNRGLPTATAEAGRECHGLRVRSHLNTITLRIPYVDVSLTAEQVAVLAAVVGSVVASPLPRSLDVTKNTDERINDNSEPLTELELRAPVDHAVTVRIQRAQLRWGIRAVDWLTDTARNHLHDRALDAENEDNDMASNRVQQELRAVLQHSQARLGLRDAEVDEAMRTLDQSVSRRLQEIVEDLLKQYAITNMKFYKLSERINLQNAAVRAQAERDQLKNVRFELLMEHCLAAFVDSSSQLPFLRVSLLGCGVALVIAEDYSGEFTLEMRHMTVDNLDDANEIWRPMISPLLPPGHVWSDRDTMLTVHAQERIINNVAGFPHAEINIYPINIKITYDIIARLISFFNFEQERIEADSEISSLKTDFLPSAHLLSINTTDRTTSGIPAFLPMSPMASNNSAGNNGVILLRSSMKRFHTRAASHSNSSTLQVPAVEKVGGSTAISSLSSHRRFLSAAMDVWQEHKRLKDVDEKDENESDAQTSAVSEALVPNTSLFLSRSYFFTYVRLGGVNMAVSYRGNNIGLENFEGLQVKMQTIVFQRKSWSLLKLFSRLQHDLIVDLVSQVHSTLGRWIQYKVGFRADMQRRAAGIADSTTDGLEMIHEETEDTVLSRSTSSDPQSRLLTSSELSNSANPVIFARMGLATNLKDINNKGITRRGLLFGNSTPTKPSLFSVMLSSVSSGTTAIPSGSPIKAASEISKTKAHSEGGFGVCSVPYEPGTDRIATSKQSIVSGGLSIHITKPPPDQTEEEFESEDQCKDLMKLF